MTSIDESDVYVHTMVAAAAKEKKEADDAKRAEVARKRAEVERLGLELIELEG